MLADGIFSGSKKDFRKREFVDGARYLHGRIMMKPCIDIRNLNVRSGQVQQNGKCYSALIATIGSSRLARSCSIICRIVHKSLYQTILVMGIASDTTKDSREESKKQGAFERRLFVTMQRCIDVVEVGEGGSEL